MSIKRILVHLDHHEEHGRAPLQAGIVLARRFDAQLHGLFVIEPGALPMEGRAASLAFLSESITLLKEKASIVEAEFKDQCEREKISHAWSCIQGDTLKILTEYSFCADITLVGQQQSGGFDGAISLHHLPLLSSGPVLILPPSGRMDVSAEDILIAWKPDRSCARAVHDALPMLARAKSVTLLTVDPHTEWNLPDTAIGDYLAAHDVQVAVETRRSGTFQSVGDAILTAAKEIGSGLVVMGGDGHSNLAELIFGGTTRDVLHETHLPVLMSH